MAGPLPLQLNPNPNPNPIIFQEDCDGLPTPPLDPFFFSSKHLPSRPQNGFDSDPASPFDDNYDFDFDFNFDDVNVDDLFLPSDTDPIILPHHTNDSGVPVALPDGCVDNFPPDPASSLSVGCGISRNRGSNMEEYLNCSPSDAGSCDSGGGTSICAGNMNSGSSLSSQGSGSACSGLPKGMAALCPDSDNFVVDQRIEEVGAKNDAPKRKKEDGEDGNGEIRNQKHRRAENSDTNTFLNNVISQCDSFGTLGEEEEKKRARLMRNRESAQLSRQRKKQYVEELEDKVRAMHSTIADLNSKISFFVAENVSLRQQLSGNGMPSVPMYAPLPPVAYPWVPCPPYAVKPQGSMVPLVPIPRLKRQYPVSASNSKKVESKKAEGKTKKVASVTFLGLLFFIMLFGGLVPIVNVKFQGFKEIDIYSSGPGGEILYNQQRGQILVVNGHSNGSQENMDVGFPDGKFDIGSRIHSEAGNRGCSEHEPEMEGGTKLPGSDESIHLGNSSEQLFASLFVPRNDKLVKIDGNLIIHSVLASERAMASHDTSDVYKNKETGLAVSRGFSSALALPDAGGRHPHFYQHPERQKALTSGPDETLKDNLKFSANNGKLQEWFREGLAGPMLSSGLCTEVFQFDVSSTAGAIIPASSVANTTADQPHNTTHPNKGRNRRILRGPPVPLQISNNNNSTGEHGRRKSEKTDFQGNKSVSPAVVSILVDPREVGDIEVDGMIRTKSLARIFVVVLLDSVKYVTYSCVLPHASAHLVTT